jgi:mannosyltransferase
MTHNAVVPAEVADQAGAPAGWRGRAPSWLVVAIPVLAELIVGGYRIAGPSLWRDEAATISGSQRPVGAIFALTGNQDAVHGVYYLFMHVVIAIGGTSETVLRLPSLIAMSLAAGLVAALGRRLATDSAIPAPGAMGLTAGLLLTAVPLTTRYAQEARPYALTTLFAVLATYCLVHAAAERGESQRSWWVAYAAALILTGAVNLFAVLLAAAHGVSLLLGRRTGVMKAWLVACAVAGVALAPVAVLSASQASQLNWVTTPGPSAVASLVRDFSGGLVLIPVALVLGWLGCLAGRGLRGAEAGLTLAGVALPWLVVPPALLLAVSFAHPVYVERYVMFCLPALSLLVAAGLTGLVRLTGRAVSASAMADGRRARVLALAPSALLALIIVAGSAGPQLAIRQPAARADDLRAVAAVIRVHELPGDAVVYLPWQADVVGMAYPVPFRPLRNVELGLSPTASATLRGEPASPAIVAARLSGVRRVWTIQWAQPLAVTTPTPGQRVAQRAIAGMRLLRRWRISSVVLSLYVTG